MSVPGAGTSGGGGASFSTSFSDISTGLFGTDTSASGTGTSTQAIDRTLTEGLEIDEVGLLAMIDKALSGVGGLAEIFGLEAGAGLFGGSVATQQTTDLLAAIAGELAQVTGVTTTTETGTTTGATTEEQTSESAGILDSIGLGGSEGAAGALALGLF